MRKYLLILWLCFGFSFMFAQTKQDSLGFKIKKTGKFTDEYSDSSVLSVGDDGKGGVVVARSYRSNYGSKHGYLFEHYNDKMIRVKSYKYEIKKKRQDIVGVVLDKSKVHIIDFVYEKKQKAYVCYGISSDVKDFKFEKKELFRLVMKKERRPWFSVGDVSRYEDYYHANISFNKDKTAFAILVDLNTGRKKGEVHDVYVFNTKLDLLFKNSLNKDFKGDAYKFEAIDIAEDGSAAYILGKLKGEERKKRKEGPDYYYDLTKITNTENKTQIFDTQTHYIDELKVIAKKDKIACVGLYSTKGKDKQRGICYYDIDPVTMDLKITKANPFTDDFIKGYDKDELESFRANEMFLTQNNEIIFNAEQYSSAITSSANPSSSITHTRYSYGDILSSKINKDGEVVRYTIIDKGQIGNNASHGYLSYSAMLIGNEAYFFINGTVESKNPDSPYIDFSPAPFGGVDFNMVKINEEGKVSYKKIFDNKENKTRILLDEAGLLPAINTGYFLNSIGKEKQLIRVKL